MKRIAAFLVVIGSAAFVEAQETYTISANANQVNQIRRGASTYNNSVCQRLALAVNCTQAQACTAANAPGGAACTPAQARSADARIYPDTQPGREEFLTYALVARDVQDLNAQAITYDQRGWCINFKAATQPQKDQACTSVGYTPGCNPCP